MGGNITGSNIAGSTITGNTMIQTEYGFWAREGGGNRHYDVGVGGFMAIYLGSYQIFGDHDTQIYMRDDGAFFCKEITIDSPPFYGRNNDLWTLSETMQDVYNRFNILKNEVENLGGTVDF